MFTHCVYGYTHQSNTAELQCGSCQNVNKVRKAGRHFTQWKSHFGYWRDSHHLSEPSAAVSETRSIGHIMKRKKKGGKKVQLCAKQK